MEIKRQKNNNNPTSRTLDGFVVKSRGSAHYTPRAHTTKNPGAIDWKIPANTASVKRDTTPAQKPESNKRLPSISLPDFDIPQFDLPKYVAPERPNTIVSHRRRWVRIMAQMGAVFGLLLVVTGSYMFWRSYVDLHKVFTGSGTVAALTSQRVAPELLDGEGDGRVNILLLGIGGPAHPGGDLTDTIVVFSVDPVNGTAAMLSVPRDLWVKMPVNYFGKYQKINAAYSSGKYDYLGRTDLKNNDSKAVQAGLSSIDEAVGTVLGLRINYHVLVNFEAFREAVDTVQGVTLDVKSPLYDPTMAWENNNNPILAAAGLQTMDGKQALNYARSRETSSDFARGERQRELLVALKDRVLTLGTLSNPTKIAGLMSTLGSNVHTDLSTEAAARLFTITSGIKDDEIASLSLTEPTQLVTTDRVGSFSVVRPIAGFDTYSDIQDYVRLQLRDGYLAQEDAPIYVLANSEEARANMVKTLGILGYNIAGSTVTDKTLPTTKTVINQSAGKSPYTEHYLLDRYGKAASAEALPIGIQVPTSTQFVILAGT